MSKSKVKYDESQAGDSEKGCYGKTCTSSEIKEFLQDCFNFNDATSGRQPKFATCIWSSPGIGKTALIKSFLDNPIVWEGKEYPGYDVRDVPLAQFEEMGDLMGMPDRFIHMKKGELTKWIPKDEEIINIYKNQGYEIDLSEDVQMRYAPPSWVPSHEGPAILLFDDWNRASIRIIKGIMQLIQNHAMVSWSLPKGCNIVLTGNPDESEYNVTSVDKAILTRIKHISMRFDIKEWAVWAERNNLDHRGIGFGIQHPEILMGNMTNPRTFSKFCSELKFMADSETERMVRHASSLLDSETVSAFITYIERDMKLIIDPEDILSGKKLPESLKLLKEMAHEKEPRIDIISVICERVFGRVVNSERNKDRILNFQKFILDDNVPKDIRYGICNRVARYEKAKHALWLLGNKELNKFVLEVSNI